MFASVIYIHAILKNFVKWFEQEEIMLFALI